MILPTDDRFVTDLVLQRTRPYIAIAGKAPLAEWTRTGARDGLLPALGSRRSEFVAAAVAEILQDAAEYAARLHGPRLVSIGCGVGIAEVALCRALGCESVLLVDTETGGKGHGFAHAAAGYGNLERAAQLLQGNGVHCEVATWNPSRQPEPSFRFDSLVSMYAMGFHFPVGLYAGFIERNAAPGAVVAHDSRVGRIIRAA